MSNIKLTREERLAQALRDNLRKRKASSQSGETKPTPSAPSVPKPPID